MEQYGGTAGTKDDEVRVLLICSIFIVGGRMFSRWRWCRTSWLFNFHSSKKHSTRKTGLFPQKDDALTTEFREKKEKELEQLRIESEERRKHLETLRADRDNLANELAQLQADLAKKQNGPASLHITNNTRAHRVLGGYRCNL